MTTVLLTLKHTEKPDLGGNKQESKQNQHIYSELFISGSESSSIPNDNLEYDFNLSDVIKNAVTLSKEKPHLRTNSPKKDGSCNLKYTYPCGICRKSVKNNQKAIFCTVCLKWIHRKCNGTSNKEYDLLNVLEDNSTPWQCILCNIEDFNQNGTE